MSGAHSAEERWRHAWAAFVLGAIAVIALGLISFVLTTSHAHPQGAGPPVLLTQVPSRTSASQSPSNSASHTRPASRASTAPTTSASSAALPRTSAVAATTVRASVVARPTRPAPPPRPTGPCPTDRPCVVPGTAQVPAALSEYRTGHGQPGGVAGVVTQAAQGCALTAGDGPSCAGPFAVAREPQLSGRSAVGDIGAGYGNWLLDPKLTGVEVGWAYLPRTGRYVCVLIERS